ncbi:putative toxin-antitoxin system toxin component, PIN family [Thermococci archaeon]|nr:MAG: putative toxin-antitoxin system toxin component, PIN family [Thermococci archaeon]
MEVVLDYNVVFSAFQKKGTSYLLLVALILDPTIRILVPEYFWEEFEKHEEKLLRHTKLSQEEFEKMLSILKLYSTSVPKELFENELKKAVKLCRDKGGVPYVALALHRRAILITGDLNLKADVEGIIPAYTPREFLELLGR